jgi:hypothetical protein
MLRVAVLVLLLMTSLAHAGGIVLESYTGERPADAPRLLAPVLEELARRDYAAGDTVARSYEAQASRAATTPGGLPSDFATQVDRGFQAWVGGRLDEAIKILVPLVETARANTGAFAKDPAQRDPLQKALIALALAYQRNGDLSAMRTTFGELLRSFPEAQVSRATYGPEAAQAFDQVRREIKAAGHGKLAIRCADTAVVFIDEMYRGPCPSTFELAPGEHRVVVMMNNQPSRNHRVMVRPNAETALEIDAKLDQAIRTTGYTGLGFATEADRDAHEAAYAQRFAKTVGANAVAVVGIDTVRGRAAVVGLLVSLQTGREIRRASIAVEPDPSRDKLGALARFLAGEEPAPGLEVQFAGPEDSARAELPVGELPASAPRWGGWRFVTAGAAAAGIATGVVLIALDGTCPETPPAGQQCNNLYATATPGYVALGVGAGFAALAIYLFATHRAAPVAAPAPGGATGATVGFVVRF